MRASASKIALLAILALALAAASPLAAQEPGPFPYFFVYTSVVRPGMETAYLQSVAAVVEASKKSPKGLPFATYTNATGDERVYAHFIGMQTMGEMDGWATIDQIIAEGLGAERAAKVLQGLSGSADTTARLLRHDANLSNPGTAPVPLPPPMVLWVGFSVPTEHTAEFVTAATNYVTIARKNAKAANAIAYQTTLGGEGSEFSFFVGLSKWGDMDGRPTIGEVLEGGLGAQAAAAARDQVATYASMNVAMLTYVPALSNVPAP